MALYRKVLQLLWAFLLAYSPLASAVVRQLDGSEGCFLKYSSNSPTSSTIEQITFEFKTIEGSGLILYADEKVENGDYMMVELVGGRIRYKGKFGAGKDNEESILEVFAGENLGNNVWHKVKIERTGHKVTVTINGGRRDGGFLKSSAIAEGSFVQLSLSQIFVGGKLSQSFDSPPNFKGCLKDLLVEINAGQGLDLLGTISEKNKPGCVANSCRDVAYKPYSFTQKNSKMMFTITKSSEIKGSFAFRTYSPNGVLLLQGKENDARPSLKIYYSSSSVHLDCKIGSVTQTKKVDKRVHDGFWHTVRFSVPNSPSGNAEITVDGAAVSTNNLAEFTDNLQVGGSFVGCMKDLMVGGKTLTHDRAESSVDIVIDKCHSQDLCRPNPCMNKGACSQDLDEVTCTCAGGQVLPNNPVCQFAEYEKTCNEIKKKDPNAGNGDKMIDPDGSGPLPAMKVRCDFPSADAEKATTTVNAVEGRKQVKSSSGVMNVKVAYKDVSVDWAHALAMRSQSCKQRLSFECKNSRLFSDTQNFADWVAYGGALKTYWGGATKSGQCACAATGTCRDQKNCNCYKQDSNSATDSGDLTDKMALPVVEVNLEDVGPNSDSYLTVGNLICEGSGSPNNVVTFVYEDSKITLPPWQPAVAGDIAFEFRTAYSKGDLLYTEGTSGHFYRLRILGEKVLEVSFKIGNTDSKLHTLQVETLTPVNNLEWHSVHVYRNVKEFGLIVDGVKNTLSIPYEYLDVQDNLVVGFYWEDVMNGFIGCMRDMFVNGVFVDLVKVPQIDNKYLKKGCTGQCTPETCTFGQCVEKYNTFECDCSKTPYQGYSCHKEIKGATFKDGHDGISMKTLGFPFESYELKIVFAFKASTCTDTQTIIFIKSATVQQYYSVELTAGGNLRFSFFLTQTVNVALGDKNLCDGKRHTVYIYRNRITVTYSVDKETGSENNSGGSVFNKFTEVSVGKDPDNGRHFKGCLSGVGIDFKDDAKSYSVQPLSWYLNQYASGDKNIEKGNCFADLVPAVAKPEVYVPTPSPRKRGQTGGEPVGGKRVEEGDDNSAVIIVVVLLLVLLIVALLGAIVWFMVRNKGVYHTHEGNDEELRLDDQNVALAGSQPGDGKKKEWYI